MTQHKGGLAGSPDHENASLLTCLHGVVRSAVLKSVCLKPFMDNDSNRLRRLQSSHAFETRDTRLRVLGHHGGSR